MSNEKGKFEYRSLGKNDLLKKQCSNLFGLGMKMIASLKNMSGKKFVQQKGNKQKIRTHFGKIYFDWRKIMTSGNWWETWC